MNAAVENLILVSISAVVFFLVAIFLIKLLQRFHQSPEFRTIKRKPLLIPAIVFLVVLIIAPRQSIGPPQGMESNSIRGELRTRLESSFEVYDWTPYLTRVRAEYSYPLHHEEIIECTVLVYQVGTLIQNQTTEIHFSGSETTLSTAHSTFDLTPGVYDLVFTERVLQADGTPTSYIRTVELSFSQLQDYTWIEVSIEWDQYQLALYVIGIAIILLGIYVTDHNFDTPEEYERYQRKKNGGRNYPYSRSYRKRMKQRNS